MLATKFAFFLISIISFIPEIVQEKERKRKLTYLLTLHLATNGFSNDTSGIMCRWLPEMSTLNWRCYQILFDLFDLHCITTDLLRLEFFSIKLLFLWACLENAIAAVDFWSFTSTFLDEKTQYILIWTYLTMHKLDKVKNFLISHASEMHANLGTEVVFLQKFRL